MPPDQVPVKTIKSGREFCALYFPKAHAAGTCSCTPKVPQRVLVIRSRHAR